MNFKLKFPKLIVCFLLTAFLSSSLFAQNSANEVVTYSNPTKEQTETLKGTLAEPTSEQEESINKLSPHKKNKKKIKQKSRKKAKKKNPESEKMDN